VLFGAAGVVGTLEACARVRPGAIVDDRLAGVMAGACEQRTLAGVADVLAHEGGIAGEPVLAHIALVAGARIVIPAGKRVAAMRLIGTEVFLAFVAALAPGIDRRAKHDLRVRGDAAEVLLDCAQVGSRAGAHEVRGAGVGDLRTDESSLAIEIARARIVLVANAGRGTAGTSRHCRPPYAMRTALMIACSAGPPRKQKSPPRSDFLSGLHAIPAEGKPCGYPNYAKNSSPRDALQTRFWPPIAT
jgi:hypothetical protein